MNIFNDKLKAALDKHLDDSWFNDDIIKLTPYQQKLLKEDMEYRYNNQGKKGFIMKDL